MHVVSLQHSVLSMSVAPPGPWEIAIVAVLLAASAVIILVMERFGRFETRRKRRLLIDNNQWSGDGQCPTITVSLSAAQFEDLQIAKAMCRSRYPDLEPTIIFTCDQQVRLTDSYMASLDAHKRSNQRPASVHAADSELRTLA